MVNSVKQSEFLDFMSSWNVQKIENEYFDDLFNIDGIALWWFYRPMFMKNMLPSSFGTLTDVFNSINSKRKK